MFLKGVELFLEICGELGLAGLTIQVSQLIGILLQIVHFPLVPEAVEVHQFVALGADAVVARHHMEAWVFVVVIVNAGAPVLGALALEQRHEGTALHVAGNLGAGDV